MKKIFVISLMLIYGTSSFGMTVYFHYCCGKLKTIDLVPAERVCKMTKAHKMNANPCCESKEVNLKINDDHSLSKIITSAWQPVVLNISYFGNINVHWLDLHQRVPEIFSPPPLPADLNKLHCVYRI